MEDSTKSVILIGFIVIEFAIMIWAIQNMLSYEESDDVNCHKSNYVEQQKESFVNNDFKSTSTYTVADNGYKIKVDDHDVIVTVDVKNEDGTELSEEDKKLIAKILRQYVE